MILVVLTLLRDGRWCWEPWRSYVFDGGKDAPCRDEPITEPEGDRG